MHAQPVSPLTLARWAAGKVVRRWLGISPRPVLRSSPMEPNRPPITVDTVWTADDAQAMPTAYPMRADQLKSSADFLGWDDYPAENIRQVALWLRHSDETGADWRSVGEGDVQVAACWLLRLREIVYTGRWGLG